MAPPMRLATAILAVVVCLASLVQAHQPGNNANGHAKILRKRRNDRCAPGQYSSTGYSPCQDCPPGSYSKEHGQRTCIRARPGYHCPGAGMKQEQHCTPGTYSSASGSTDCDPCPPGAMCPHNAVHSPQLCSPGRYSTGGWVNCETCNPGTFNNIHGAVTCCPCPAGCFATSSGNTNCQRCPNQKPYSNPGSPSHGHCSSMKGSYAPESDCQKGGNGFCSPGTPFLGGSGLPRRQLSFKDACEPGYQPCPNYRGTTSIGIDCVDILNDLESCGGCVDYSLDGAADGGRDCTAIPFADRVRCVNGKCIIDSCSGGLVPSSGKGRCILPDTQ